MGKEKPRLSLTPKMWEALRGRRGLEPADTRADSEIKKMDRGEIVRECARWYLGDGSWAREIASWIIAAGADLKDV